MTVDMPDTFRKQMSKKLITFDLSIFGVERGIRGRLYLRVLYIGYVVAGRRACANLCRHNNNTLWVLAVQVVLPSTTDSPT